MNIKFNQLSALLSEEHPDSTILSFMLGMVVKFNANTAAGHVDYIAAKHRAGLPAYLVDYERELNLARFRYLIDKGVFIADRDGTLTVSPGISVTCDMLHLHAQDYKVNIQVNITVSSNNPQEQLDLDADDFIKRRIVEALRGDVIDYTLEELIARLTPIAKPIQALFEAITGLTSTESPLDRTKRRIKEMLNDGILYENDDGKLLFNEDYEHWLRG